MNKNNGKYHKMLKSFLHNCRYIIALVILITISICVVVYWDNTMAIVGNFLSVIAPFIVGFFIAYLIKPIVNAFEKLLDKCKPGRGMKIKKAVSVIISYMIVVGAITILIVYIYPQLKDSGQDLRESIEHGYHYMINNTDKINQILPFINLSDIMEYVKSNLFDNIMYHGTTIAPYLYRLSTSLFGMVYNIFMGLIISIYIVIDSKRLVKSFQKVVYAIVPKKHAASIWSTIRECNHIFNGFLFGKALDSLIIGIICFVAMSILRLPYPLLMSIIVGVTNMIPYFGPIIGAVPGVLLYLFIDPKLSLIFAIMILVLQQFDGLYLGPRILGDLTGIKPLWVIFGVTVGGAYFGALGMFLGVPAVAVLMYLANLMIERSLKRKEYDLSDSE